MERGVSHCGQGIMRSRGSGRGECTRVWETAQMQATNKAKKSTSLCC